MSPSGALTARVIGCWSTNHADRSSTNEGVETSKPGDVTSRYTCHVRLGYQGVAHSCPGVRAHEWAVTWSRLE